MASPSYCSLSRLSRCFLLASRGRLSASRSTAASTAPTPARSHQNEPGMRGGPKTALADCAGRRSGCRTTTDAAASRTAAQGPSDPITARPSTSFRRTNRPAPEPEVRHGSLHLADVVLQLACDLTDDGVEDSFDRPQRNDRRRRCRRRCRCRYSCRCRCRCRCRRRRRYRCRRDGRRLPSDERLLGQSQFEEEEDPPLSLGGRPAVARSNVAGAGAGLGPSTDPAGSV
jgi:hypothetical protein